MGKARKERQARLARRAANHKAAAEAARTYFSTPKPDTARSAMLKRADKQDVEVVGKDRGKRETVKLAELHIDETYQYLPEQEKGRVNQLMNWLLERGGFDVLTAGVIHVNRRADGTLWIMDGGGRAWMARKAGRVTIDANVYDGLTWSEEHAKFVELNNNKRTIRRPHMFLVEANAGVEPHATIVKYLNEASYGMERTVGDGGCALFSASSLLFVFYLDGTGTILRLALQDLRNTVGDESGVDGRLLIAVAWMRALGAGNHTTHLRYIIQVDPREDEERSISVKDTLAKARHDAGRFITTRSPQSRDTNPYLLDVLLGRFNYRRAKDPVKARRLEARNIGDFKARFDAPELVERFGKEGKKGGKKDGLSCDVWAWNS